MSSLSASEIGERLKRATAELSSLGRVDHRLGMTQASQLPKVLNLLLPRLLARIGTNQANQKEATNVPSLLEKYQSIHQKLVGMLSHIMKRVRSDSECQLPCPAILQLLLLDHPQQEESTKSLLEYNKAVNAFTLNLALAFLTLGIPRCRESVVDLLPGLLVVLGHHSGVGTLKSPATKLQSSQIAHLVLRVLERIVLDEPQQAVLQRQKRKADNDDDDETTKSSIAAMEKVRLLLQSSSEISQALFDLLLDALLYQTSTSPTMPPSGLSQSGHERLRVGTSDTAKDWAAEMAPTKRLRDLKLALLTLLAPTRRWALLMNNNNPLGTCQTVAILVAVSGDSHLDVAERASSYLKAYLDTMRSKDGGSTEELGNSVRLVCGLLSLTLGETNAESLLASLSKSSLATLGRFNTMSNGWTRQQILSLKRRKASLKTSGAMYAFVTKALDDHPHLLQSLDEAQPVASLVVNSCSTTFHNMGSTTGFTVTRAGPYSAAAQLLNSLCIRLTNNPKLLSPPVLELLSKALSSCCAVLGVASIPRPPSAMNEGSVSIRDSLYGAVSNLARSNEFCQKGSIFARGQTAIDMTDTCSIETATLLFSCSTNEEEPLRPRAVAALDALLGAYCRIYQVQTVVPVVAKADDSNPWSQIATTAPTPGTSEQNNTNNKMALSKSLLPLLWGAAQISKAKSSRVSAARWTSDLLKGLDLPNACHLLCFLAGDPDVTAAAIAREGLGLTKIGDAYQDKDTTLRLPDFQEVTNALFTQTLPSRQCFHDFSYLGKAAALRFSLVCLLHDLYGGDDEAVEKYVHAMTKTLTLFGTAQNRASSAGGRESIDLLDETAICLAGCLATSRFAREMIVHARTNYKLVDMEALTIAAPSSKARRYLGEACGSVYEDHRLYDGTDLLDWVSKCGVDRPLRASVKTLTDTQNGQSSTGQIHGASFLGARCVRAFRLEAARRADKTTPSDCWDFCSVILESLGKNTLHQDETVGNASSISIGIALSYDTIDTPILDKRLYAGVERILTQLDVALRKFGNGDHTDPTRVSALAEAAGQALAASTTGSGHASEDSQLGPKRLTCVDALFSLVGSTAYRQDHEVALKAGEALASYSDALSPKSAVWSSSMSDWPDVFDDGVAKQMPPHQQVIFTLLTSHLRASSPHKRTATAPALLAVVARAARQVNSSLELKSRALVTELITRLPEVQEAFIALLADPKCKQLSRESCCLGLAACQGLAEAVGREMSNDTLTGALNERLLRAFGHTTNHGGSAMMETRAQNAERLRSENREGAIAQDSTADLTEPFGMETEVGGAAGLGEAALGAFREMAGAAMALGRSDILYALLLLCVSHPVWSTPGPRERYGASALLGENSIVGSRTNASEMRDALRPHLGQLLPRLLRAKHDPNKQTREQMETLWLGLTGGGAEARQIISQHLLPTVDALIDDATNKLWRARVGSCSALSEVIVGRTWQQLGGGDALLDDDEVMIKTSTEKTSAAVRLLRLWRVAVRALDDIRLTVRESGESLGRSVRGLTIRLCDPNAINETESIAQPKSDLQRDARSAAATALRWLVKHGLNQQCAEATGVCVSCLIGVVDVVSPTTLEPVLAELIGALLMAMSGLEPAALNYLQVRAAGRSASSGTYERLERARLQLAQSGPLAKALNKCLEMVSSVDLDTQQSIIPQLDSALRCAAGFATRAATADAVSSLTASCASAFKFPGTSSTNPTVRLLRAFYFASEREYGQGAKDKMVHALGNLASLAPGQSVRALALRACDRCASATGSNEDPATRRAAAAAIRAIAVRASRQFADGGPNDIWCRTVLPMAFLGQRDKESKIASLWKEVWEEGELAANSSGMKRYGVLVEEKLLSGLVRACTKALEDVSWDRRITGAMALTELCEMNILAPTATSLSGKVSPEDTERAKRRAKASNLALMTCVKVMVRPRIWGGKSHVVRALVKIASQWAMVGFEDVDMRLFGWEESGTCPWVPVMQSPQSGENDLFLGDRWFLSRVPAANIDETEDTPAAPMDVEAEEDEAKMDFSEGDVVLEQIESENTDVEMEEASSTVEMTGLCRVLLLQAIPEREASSTGFTSEETLPYGAASLQGIAQVLNSLVQDGARGRESVKKVFTITSKAILEIVDREKIMVSETRSEQPPLIVARAIDALAASLWSGFGVNDGATDLVSVFRAAGGSKQPAWTVREAAANAASILALRCHENVLRKHETLSILLDCTKQAVKDRKFWKVRFAGLKILKSLVSRVGGSTPRSVDIVRRTTTSSGQSQSRQLILEALLPHKEQILSLARPSLSDAESTITAISSEICGAIGWWP